MCLSLLTACSPAGTPSASEDVGSLRLGDVLVWIDPLVLQDSRDAVTQRVDIREWERGFLVADTRNARLLTFGPEGTFLRTMGGMGEGPGEFASMSLPTLLPENLAAVTDARLSRVTIWDLTSGRLVKVHNTQVRGWTVWGVDEETVLLGQRWSSASPEAGLVTTYDLASDSIVSSWYVPTVATREAYATQAVALPRFGRAPAGEIAMVFGVRDSLVLVSPDGSGRRMFSLDSGMTPPDAVSDEEFEAWVAESGWLQEVYEVASGGWLVQRTRQTPERWEYGLVRIDEEGRVMWRVDPTDMPRLLEVGRDGVLYFEGDDLRPNVIRRARLQPGL